MNTISKTYGKVKACLLSSATLALCTAAIMSSCSNSDWEFDNPESGTTVYFAQQAPIRTITLGNCDEANNADDNAHQFEIMATMGGVYSNGATRKVAYKIDPTILEDGSGMEVLPSSYYTVDDAANLTIPAGKIVGGTKIHLTDAFFNDPLAATNHYVLPLTLVSTESFDSILASKSTQLICVKYKNQYSGLYCKTGTAAVEGLKTLTYKNEDAVMEVSTVNMNTCQATYAYPVKEFKYDADKDTWSEVDATKNITVQYVFAADGKCTVYQDGVQIGTGEFSPRGIKDFSDERHSVDCLKVQYKVTITTNAGDVDHEKVWTVNVNMTKSLMNRGNKLESWK